MITVYNHDGDKFSLRFNKDNSGDMANDKRLVIAEVDNQENNGSNLNYTFCFILEVLH